MSLRRSFALVSMALALAGGGAGGSVEGAVPATAQESQATGIFHGVGVVRAIDGASGALTIDHEEIKGFMAAMEMMYRVDPSSLSEGLRAGDRIAFEIDARRYTIVGVKVVERAK